MTRGGDEEVWPVGEEGGAAVVAEIGRRVAGVALDTHATASVLGYQRWCVPWGIHAEACDVPRGGEGGRMLGKDFSNAEELLRKQLERVARIVEPSRSLRLFSASARRAWRWTRCRFACKSWREAVRREEDTLETVESVATSTGGAHRDEQVPCADPVEDHFGV